MDKKEIASRFKPVRPVSKMAEQILKKRYYKEGEKSWEDVANRVVDDIASDWNEDDKEIIRQMIINRYMVPNSPCLVNAGNPNGGKLACFVVDFKDTIEDIYKTKLDFALIARKGGGCGTTLSKIRPEGAKVAGSTHGYAGGPVKFADTISHDMDALTQAGFRQMAMLFSMSVYHPDIIKFINAKAEEGRIENANLSVMVDDNFMRMVEQDKTYWTQFNGEKYNEYRARDIFDMIVEGMWRGGEPGVLFYDRINDSPYKYTGQVVETTNPCLDKDTLLWDGDRYVKISENPKTFKSWKTGEKETIKLYTNIGYQIILTPDHKIMLADGSFIEAKDSLGKEIMWKGDRGPELAVTISGIKPMGIREVWDFSNEVHYNTANGGFVVHNCGEEPMPPGGSCFAKDSLLMTSNGIRKISEVKSGMMVSSSTGDNTIVKPFIAYKTGVRDLLKITLEGGASIRTTPEHIFITNKGEVKAEDLIEKDAKVKWMEENPFVDVADDTLEENELPVLLGWLHGDGWMTSHSLGVSFNKNDGDYEVKDKILSLFHKYFGERKPLRNDGISYQEQTDRGFAYEKLAELGVVLNRATQREIPEIFYTWNIRQQICFLRALFTADGNVAGKAKSQIQFSTSSKKLAEQLQSILAVMGIQSRQYITRFSPKENRNDQIKIIISKASAIKYMKTIGFLSDYKNNKFNYNCPKYPDKKFLNVEKIEYDSEEEVYDFTIENTHKGYVNGILVHNCDLGSIDFSKFLTPEGEIDFDLLDIASRYTVRFLDSVLDKNSFPTEDSRIWAERNRAIGVGGMGYADLLLMMKIPYGSQEALDVLESIMKVMEFATEDESIKLGQEKGIPEECKKLPVPRRNIVLRTFAPTGTCSILAGCSNSLEPIFSEVTVRNDKTGTYTLVNNLAEQPYFRCAVSANGAQEVTVEEHIKTLALAQKYIDSGVSKTINAPTTIKRDAIAKAIFMAWQEGCKGITLYRNGSRKKEVLTPKNIKKGKCPVCGSDLIEINGKMKCLSCKKDFDMSGKEFSYN
jgi:ribonucleotide reductase alpha subunit